MDRYVEATRLSIKQENWYAALMIALTLPDICARFEHGKASAEEYADWFDEYLAEKFTVVRRDGPDIFLSGKDCYALRCALLHQGMSDIRGQRARERLNGFAFIEPPRTKSSMHNSIINNILALHVDVFCEQMCVAVEQWIQKMDKEKPKVIRNFSQILNVVEQDENGSYRIVGIPINPGLSE